MKKFVLFFLLITLGLTSHTQNKVLIIYDDLNVNTDSLKTALENNNCIVDYSATMDDEFDGTNPNPFLYNTVIHMNGLNYGDDMPLAGQDSLVKFVKSGGFYISGAWNSYDYDDDYLQNLEDLILINYVDEIYDTISYKINPVLQEHAILKNIPDTFFFDGGAAIGSVHEFTESPSKVLMYHDNDTSPALVYRLLEEGRVLYFSHSSNYDEYPVYADSNIQQLYIDAIRWSEKDIQTLTFPETIDKTYGDANFNPGASDLELSLSYSLSNDTVAAVVDGEIQVISTGIVDIRASQAGNDTVNNAISINKQLTVDKATLEVVAQDTSKYVGNANPAFRITYTGWKYTDDIDALETLPTATCIADESSIIGEYDIRLSGGMDEEYAFSYTTGTLTVLEESSSVNIISEHPIDVYPNPVSNKLYISSNASFNQIVLYDLNGRLLYKSDGSNRSIDMSEYENGMYIITINSEKRIIVVNK